MSNQANLESAYTKELDIKLDELSAKIKTAVDAFKTYLLDFCTNKFEDTEITFRFEEDFFNRNRVNKIRVYFSNKTYFWGGIFFDCEIKIDKNGTVTFNYSHSSGGRQDGVEPLDCMKCFTSWMADSEAIYNGVLENTDFCKKSLDSIVDLNEQWDILASKRSIEINKLKENAFVELENKIRKNFFPRISPQRANELMNVLTSSDWKTLHFAKAKFYQQSNNIVRLSEITIESYLTESGARRFKIKEGLDERAIKKSDVLDVLLEIVTLEDEELTSGVRGEIIHKLQEYGSSFKSTDAWNTRVDIQLNELEETEKV